MIPPELSMWGNSQYGNCVSAEEAAAKAAASVALGKPELFITEDDVIAWANKYGYLNGATLTDVMDTLQTSGLPAAGQLYTDGPYHTVDWTQPDALASAIAVGPVKLGIDADALPATAGNQQGWYATGGEPGAYSNEDHCVALLGYGPAAWLYAQLGSVYAGVQMPPSLDPTMTAYLLFTWSTIGVVDHDWLMSTVGEAWLRVPTTPQLAPPSPPLSPTPSSTPTPIPTPGTGWSGALVYEKGVLLSAGPLLTPAPVPAPPSPAPAPGGAIAVVEQLARDVHAADWAGVGTGLANLLQDVSGYPTPGQLAQMSTGLQRRANKLRADRAAKKR